MSIIKRLFQWICYSYIAIAVFTYSFPYFFITELIISFTPYIVAIGTLLLIITIINLIIEKTTKKTLYAFTILLLGITIFLYANKLKNFYNGHQDTTQEQTNTSTGFSLFFGNIFWKNKNTDALLTQIKEKQPDIIARVEFSIEQKEKIYETIKKDYPYTNLQQRSKKYAGNIIFSKYPLESLSERTDQTGARRYNYIKILHNKIPYYIYLIHTSAPITSFHFQNRNQQLKKIHTDIINHNKTKEENAKILALGDFNITPRSSYYNIFLKSLPLTNITSSYPILFTRKTEQIPFLYAHIDQIFLSKNTTYSTIDKINIKGSDHDGFIIKNIQ